MVLSHLEPVFYVDKFMINQFSVKNVYLAKSLPSI